MEACRAWNFGWHLNSGKNLKKLTVHLLSRLPEYAIKYNIRGTSNHWIGSEKGLTTREYFFLYSHNRDKCKLFVSDFFLNQFGHRKYSENFQRFKSMFTLGANCGNEHYVELLLLQNQTLISLSKRWFFWFW